MVILDGESLDLARVAAIARGEARVALSPKALDRMQRSRHVIDMLAGGPDPVYGVNTGVGLLADVRIVPEDLEKLQRNVVRSHAAGVGEPLEIAEVRAMMVVRANVLAKGYSGIRPAVAERLCEMLNRGVTPVVPSRGSVGASGDLAPLAHMALVLIGEGEAQFEGVRIEGGEALRRAGLPPLALAPKEGLSLLNGTQAMLAVGGLALLDAEVLTRTADVVCALTLDALRGTPRAFDSRIHAARPYPGQIASAATLEKLLDGSEIRASHAACRRVQDAYSLRCAPQVHGAVRDVLAETHRVFAIELNSATDNPLVFDGEVISGGNFHGQPLALALDSATTAITTLAGISERRIDRLVNPALNENLPAFLAGNPGLESGLMMAQVTAAALVAENRVLATPASVASITTSGNKEDYVSMGMASALKWKQAVRNTRYVLAIEALAASRAIEFLHPLKSSPALERAKAEIDAVAPQTPGDRVLSGDIEAVARRLLDPIGVQP